MDKEEKKRTLKQYKKDWYAKNRERILQSRHDKYWKTRDPSKRLRSEGISEETRRKLSEAHKGHKQSEATKLKRSISAKRSGVGKWMLGRKLAPETVQKNTKYGGANGMWKGDNVGYFGLHSWINRELGKPKRCDFCGSTEKSRYEWSNISGDYHRDKNDWQRLCVMCHRRYDNARRKAA